ncbi:hypothetical protein BT93_L3619 [Corymbia citriodora subsp. variegata]|uniref:Uncharacterized protein n=1 Tax=Corymbia citriodora subsp. variegata TaxID=360336 RepID=A0A8T0CLH8_CORYI|nr:hypothetical protein BT93_L3619 [Corymbia citriodora subsp. variegata]
MASDPSAATQLKSDALMEQMKQHLSTDAGKAVTKKIGLVYQINIAPKKIGFDEVVYIVDLKKGEVTKGKKACFSIPEIVVCYPLTWDFVSLAFDRVCNATQ